MPLSQAQQNIANCDKRFRVLVSGRRFGKTHLAVRELCKAASKPDQTVWYIAPTHSMAKQIVWDKLKKKLLDLRWISKINETDLSIKLVNGSLIALRSADRPDRLRGLGLNMIILDEFQDIQSEAFYEVLRPTLSDTGGSALFCGTPKGISNWAYDIYQQQNTDPDNWASFQYTTLDGGRVPPEEIAQARSDLDERTFKQEYEASFETYSGQVYYNYGEHTITQEKIETPGTILVGMDFNIDPMSACVALRTETGITIFDEITIYGSNTDEMVQELRNRYRTQRITVYPDPASRARKTSAGGRTDLSILVNAGFRIHTRPNHPAVRDRINAVNSALKSADGHTRLRITPNCRNVIRSLSRQIYKEGTTIPDNNENLSHMADAVGYLVEYIYPVVRSINNTTAGTKTWTMKVN